MQIYIVIFVDLVKALPIYRRAIIQFHTTKLSQKFISYAVLS